MKESEAMLRDLQVELIQLAQDMAKDPQWATRMSGPFVSNPPIENDRNRRIMYVGKATHRGFWLNEFLNCATVEEGLDERLMRCSQFIMDEAARTYKSPFWKFAAQVSMLHGPGNHVFGNLVWSNLVRIGESEPRAPWGDLVAMQEHLLVPTLIAEIEEYQPNLVIFLTNTDYRKIIDELAPEGWEGEHQAFGLRREPLNGLPPMCWFQHPERKPEAQLNAWLGLIQEALA